VSKDSRSLFTSVMLQSFLIFSTGGPVAPAYQV
jgi:hypothetical protein